MFDLQAPRFLRTVLLFDAASVLFSGAPQLLVTGWLAHGTGLPAGLLVSTGLFLLAYAAFAVWIATRKPIPAAPVLLVIACNLAWSVGCVALLLAAPFVLTVWGTAYLLLHVVAVLVFASLEWFALRLSTGSAPLAG